MKERLRDLRRSLNLTQQEFAERIGIKRNTVANYESGRNVPTDSVLSLICREFGVSPEWLKTGAGEMFVPEGNEIDALADKYHLSEAIKVFIERLVNLPEKDQQVVSRLLIETAAQLQTVAESPPESEPPEMSIDEKVEAYRRALELEKKKGTSEAS